jgi:signal transduction histidine kinase
VKRLLRSLGDMSLRGKVALALTVVFLGSVGVMLLVLVPFLAEQRQRLIEQDRRLLSTLRRSYERDFIYDLLSRNRESLAVHLADLASQEGLVWVRVESGDIDLGASGDRGVITRLLGPDAAPYVGRPGVVLLVDRDGEADLVGPGGRPLLSGRQVTREEPRAEDGGPPPGQDDFREQSFGGERVLALTSTLQAAGEPYGRLHVMKSLAPLERSEALMRRLLYGGVTLSFVSVLLLLNLLLSRIVLVPVRRVHDAMARAATGDLRVRLPVHSRDEVSSMAESFNRMVGELEASHLQVESYSRNLESMVEARTAELRASEARLLATERLEAWKEAVERVIHEIKNPLTPVGLAAETLKTAWARDRERFASVFPSAIDMILGAVRDLKELIGEFSRFSRLPAMRTERLDPNALVIETLSPYTRTPPERVEVEVQLGADVPAVEADADQIKRVLLNVINNALEAMGDAGGALRLATLSEQGGVTIRIEDDGPGVEDALRIFEPHYTTKVKGTGLGLAIAKQIVEEHRGTIGALSRPGHGTRVRIHLPAAPPLEKLPVRG